MMVYFVTNICPHYRVKAFEQLAALRPLRFFFFSEPGKEKYWEKNNPTALGKFNGEYLRGWRLFGSRLRIVPSLYRHLLFDDYEVLIKCISGKSPLLFSFLIAKARGIPFILWTGLWDHPHTMIHRISFPLVRFIYRNADAIAVYGTHVSEYLSSLGVPGGRIFFAWQAVDNGIAGKSVGESAIQKRKAELGIQEHRVVLYVGRMEDQKGLEYLVEALPAVGKQIPIMFIGIGTGTGTTRFALSLEKRGFLDFRFIGYVPNHELCLYYRMADVLVLPSITTRDFKEPWGLVVNEAMNQGCPVIATDAVGAAMGGLLTDGKTGFIIPERDSLAIERSLVRVLKDHGLREAMSTAAEAEVKRWTYQRMASGFELAISHVLEKKK